MVSESERKKILEMIEDGTITADEGLTLLKALDESQPFEISPETPSVDTRFQGSLEAEFEKVLETSGYDDVAPTPSPVKHETLHEDEYKAAYADTETFAADVEVLPPGPTQPSADEIERWKRWWVIPLWIGAGITVVGGLLMYWALSANGFGFWFACAWFPFLFGVAVLALAWSSRTSPWLHVRIHQAPGERPQKIAISFPIPVRLTVWGLRTFGHHIPHMGDTSLDEVILSLKEVAKDGTPFFVDVDEGEDGERVQVFIG
jgi:hypothetical protein